VVLLTQQYYLHVGNPDMLAFNGQVMCGLGVEGFEAAGTAATAAACVFSSDCRRLYAGLSV
jgi:hypothetical protein